MLGGGVRGGCRDARIDMLDDTGGAYNAVLGANFNMRVILYEMENNKVDIPMPGVISCEIFHSFWLTFQLRSEGGNQ